MEGIPIIEHVVKMFPSEEDFIFICNSKHLEETNMRAVLMKIAPKCQIVEIPPHKKGPVYAVRYAESLLQDDEEVIVNYCDFSCYWDYADFLEHTRTRNADGAVPAYRGFHPHMLGKTNYAFMRDEKQWMLEIKEKEPFTDDRMQEYASIGTYYFKKGAYVKRYFKALMDHDINLNGEYYVSLIYNLLVNDGLKVSIYDVQHMLQWGTPQDVAEYNGFSAYFRAVCEVTPNSEVHRANDMNLIPLAGKGSRFSKEGFTDPKPLISVSGKPMIIQAADYLPKADRTIFICLEEHLEKYPLENALKNDFPDSKIVSLDKTTEGQACTCEIGLNDENPDSAVLIAACDNGMLYDTQKYKALLNDSSVDAIAWSFRNHPSSHLNPEMYGWIKTDENDVVTGVSVKRAISDTPNTDHAVVGTFYFRKISYFLEALSRMYEKDERVNGEFYVDSCLNELVEMNLNVKVFEIDHYIGWGTPNDYKTFKYWQSFFHKVAWHPYRLEKDITVNRDALDALKREYDSFEQEWV